MKKLVAFALMGVVAMLIGCGGISQKDLDDLSSRLDSKISQTQADLERKITATDAKYANMLAIEQKVKIGVDSIEKNAELLASANQRMIEILMAQRNALKEQLASVESQLEALKK